MPYIKPEYRGDLEPHSLQPAHCVGDLTYQIFRLLLDYADGMSDESFQIHCDIIGALECAKQEWYRRHTVPYEEMKIRDNGDVF